MGNARPKVEAGTWVLFPSVIRAPLGLWGQWTNSGEVKIGQPEAGKPACWLDICRKNSRRKAFPREAYLKQDWGARCAHFSRGVLWSLLESVGEDRLWHGLGGQGDVWPLTLTLLLWPSVHRGRDRFIGRRYVFTFGRFCFCLLEMGSHYVILAGLGLAIARYLEL